MTVLLLQARTNSSRLPGKVLLPLAGIPMIVLAALRAGNSGHQVKVVTSQELSDDMLCYVLANSGIDHFRGELENTLKRCVDALRGMPDDKVVVRLTGDNVFPDGSFIDEMVEDFESRNIAYLCCGGVESGLPYGVSAEITRVGLLREAHRETQSSYDREHVTPWIISKYGQNYFEKYRSLAMAQYRCTVDTLDDYLLVANLFTGLSNPKDIKLARLLERLKSTATSQIVSHLPATKLVLGTAQFGLNYGITNVAGCPEQALVNNLVRTAISNGVRYLDTARAYGDSEEVLGKALAGGWSYRATVITKLSPLDDCPAEATPELAKVFVERSFYHSCHAMKVSRLEVLMLHRAEHLTKWNGAVWSKLIELKQQRLIGQLGVSVQFPEEALMALDFEDVSFIQLPFNILDYRWDTVIKKVSLVRQQRHVIIHARSTLLQGLLTSDQEKLWNRARCLDAAPVINWLRICANQHTDGDVVDLCLRYVVSQKWIDGVVIGVDALEQLIDNLKKMLSDCWSDEQLRNILEDRPYVSDETLNPAKWSYAVD